MSYSFAKEIFPHIQSTYFDIFFPAESIGTRSFAVRARFSGVKLNFPKKMGFTCVPLILKIDIFGPQI